MKKRYAPEELIGRPIAAKMLGVCPQIMLFWERAGKIKTVRLGGLMFVPIDEVQRVKAIRAKYGCLPKPGKQPYEDAGRPPNKR